jgi:transcriptional accessory protein Tex/SPT6
MDIIAKLSEELSIKQTQIEAAVGLLDEGNTIPFIVWQAWRHFSGHDSITFHIYF